MTAPRETIIRAACGDVSALADIARDHDADRDAVALLTAMIRCDADPHPLAALAALAAQTRPPQALHAALRRALPAAASMLEQDACADLRAALAPCLYRVWNALEAPFAPDGIAACARLALAAGDARSAAALLDRIGAEGWALAPPEAQDALLQAIETDPEAAARGGGAVWRAFDDKARIRVACAAAHDVDSVADLLDRIGADGWALTPPEAQSLLLQSARRHAGAAASALLVLSDALDDDARMRLLFTAALGEDGSRAVAQSLADGCAWRDWMAGFVPDHGASADTITRWSAVAPRLPAFAAMRLPVIRPLRR